MKILVVTQTVDKQNTTLGFFHGWLMEMSKWFEFVHVICLFEGGHDLPENVSVHSLGKESGLSKIKYVFNFYKYIWKYRREYDAVFVHMNQEYVLLGGLFWKIFSKNIFFWRNHPRGNVWTRISVFFSKKVFCTSKDSFTARFKKTILMPVGVDTELFRQIPSLLRNKNSICMVGRISPIKNIDLGISAVKYMIDSGKQVSLTVVGSVLPRDEKYYSSLVSFVEKNNLGSFVKFSKAVGAEKLPEIYGSHEICLNLTESGSFDKTIVESASCGAVPLVSNKSLAGFLSDVCITQNSIQSVAESLEKLLRHDVRLDIEKSLKDFVEKNNLKNLMDKLVEEMHV